MRGRLPHPCHAQTPGGRHRLCGSGPLRRLQKLHNRLPLGAPQWNPETGKVVKCDYCMDRLDQGLLPACVSKCVTHCLSFGRVEELDQSRRERFAKTVAFELETVVSGR